MSLQFWLPVVLRSGWCGMPQPSAVTLEIVKPFFPPEFYQWDVTVGMLSPWKFHADMVPKSLFEVFPVAWNSRTQCSLLLWNEKVYTRQEGQFEDRPRCEHLVVRTQPWDLGCGSLNCLREGKAPHAWSIFLQVGLRIFDMRVAREFLSSPGLVPETLWWLPRLGCVTFAFSYLDIIRARAGQWIIRYLTQATHQSCGCSCSWGAEVQESSGFVLLTQWTHRASEDLWRWVEAVTLEVRSGLLWGLVSRCVSGSGTPGCIDESYWRVCEVDGTVTWLGESFLWSYGQSPCRSEYLFSPCVFSIFFLHLAEQGARRLPLGLCGRVCTVISVMPSGVAEDCEEQGTAWDDNLSGHNAGVERPCEAWWCGSPWTIFLLCRRNIFVVCWTRMVLCSGATHTNTHTIKKHGTHTNKHKPPSNQNVTNISRMKKQMTKTKNDEKTRTKTHKSQNTGTKRQKNKQKSRKKIHTHDHPRHAFKNDPKEQCVQPLNHTTHIADHTSLSPSSLVGLDKKTCFQE